MTPFRYDGCNSQVGSTGLNVFSYSATDFTLDRYVYDPVRNLTVDDFLWDTGKDTRSAPQLEDLIPRDEASSFQNQQTASATAALGAE